jgi:hypothetical protein
MEAGARFLVLLQDFAGHALEVEVATMLADVTDGLEDVIDHAHERQYKPGFLKMIDD